MPGRSAVLDAAAAPVLATDPVLQLQRAIGNQAVGRLIAQRKERPASALLQGHGDGFTGVIQTKLEVNSPGDQYEQEADRVADQVMRTAEPTVERGASGPELQRKCAECEKEDAAKGHHAQGLQQTVEGQDDDSPFTQTVTLRRAEKNSDEGGEVHPEVASKITDLEGGGETLSSPVQRSMESSFGHDFSGVRIHRDADAGKVSEQVSARAFTHGNHIFFGDGQYAPEHSDGKRLLAHELTHVVQQGEAAPAGEEKASRKLSRSIQRAATWDATGTVHEVNNLANVIINGGPVGITPPTLNGAIILSTGASRAAIVKPTLTFAAVAAGGVDAKVSAVGTNAGSFDETVLAPGPWTTAAPKATIGANFSTLTTCTGAGNSTFRAIGNPSDAHMFQANRRHENHHATDHHTVFNNTIKLWDTKLTAAKAAGTPFHGAAQADAEAALFAAMGGTTEQVADNYINGCFAAGNAFHGTPAGGPVGAPTDATANADCSSSSAKYHNPS